MIIYWYKMNIIKENKIKVNLYEKSHHKSSFLRKVSRDLKLNTEVLQKDIFEEQKSTGFVHQNMLQKASTLMKLP